LWTASPLRDWGFVLKTAVRIRVLCRLPVSLSKELDVKDVKTGRPWRPAPAAVERARREAREAREVLEGHRTAAGVAGSRAAARK